MFNRNVYVRVERLSKLPLPKYETPGSAAMDLCADLSRVDKINDLKPIESRLYEYGFNKLEQRLVIPGNGGRILIPSGLKVQIPEGYFISMRPRSGLSIRNGVMLVNTPSTIDSDYRGEIMIPIINLGTEPFVVKTGDRVCQMLVEEMNKIEWVVTDHLTPTERGEGGFGSTGSSVVDSSSKEDTTNQ